MPKPWMRHSPTAILARVAVAGMVALAASTNAVNAATDPLAPPANESLVMVAAARGVQIYECRVAESAHGGYAWVFVAPDAMLEDAHGRTLGRHGAGPYWEATDGSRVIGKVVQRADAPEAGAIPWLLLATTTSDPGGAFGRVTSVQRVNTAGGVAPATGCSRDTAGTKANVRYTADYRFFAPR